MLKGICYSQFDNVLGPKIAFQYPEGIVSPEAFDSVAEFFIPKESLSGRLVSMYIPEKNVWLMGVPVRLTHTKYPRNALLFNLSFVVDNDFPQLMQYFPAIEQTLVKLSQYLTTLERESEYLFKHPTFEIAQSSTPSPSQSLGIPVSINVNSSNSNAIGIIPSSSSASSVVPMSLPATPPIVSSSSAHFTSHKKPLQTIITEIYEGINSKFAATVNVDSGNTLYLKMYPSRKEAEPVLLHQVPVPVISSCFTYEGLKGIIDLWNPSVIIPQSKELSKSSSNSSISNPFQVYRNIIEDLQKKPPTTESWNILTKEEKDQICEIFDGIKWNGLPSLFIQALSNQHLEFAKDLLAFGKIDPQRTYEFIGDKFQAVNVIGCSLPLPERKLLEPFKFLKSKGFDVESCLPNGMNVFLSACYYGDVEFVRYWISSDEPLDSVTSGGSNCWMLAWLGGSSDVIQLLFDFLLTSKDHKSVLLEKDDDKRTFIDYAKAKSEKMFSIALEFIKLHQPQFDNIELSKTTIPVDFSTIISPLLALSTYRSNVSAAETDWKETKTKDYPSQRTVEQTVTLGVPSVPNMIPNAASKAKSNDSIQTLDLGFRRIIPFIDGISHVLKISQMSGVDVESTSKALKHLLYYHCIKMVDIFQFSNVYTTLPSIREIYFDHSLQQSCISYVTQGRPAAVEANGQQQFKTHNSSSSLQNPPDIVTILHIYSLFNPDTTVKKIALEHKVESQNIDIRSLVQFGVLNGFLRRIHKYPVGIHPNASNTNSSIQNIHQIIDGTHSYDELAVSCGLSYKELDAHFDTFLYK